MTSPSFQLNAVRLATSCSRWSIHNVSVSPIWPPCPTPPASTRHVPRLMLPHRHFVQSLNVKWCVCARRSPCDPIFWHWTCLSSYPYQSSLQASQCFQAPSAANQYTGVSIVPISTGMAPPQCSLSCVSPFTSYMQQCVDTAIVPTQAQQVCVKVNVDGTECFSLNLFSDYIHISGCLQSLVFHLFGGKCKTTGSDLSGLSPDGLI